MNDDIKTACTELDSIPQERKEGSVSNRKEKGKGIRFLGGLHIPHSSDKENT